MGGWRFGNTNDGAQAGYLIIPDAMANLAPTHTVAHVGGAQVCLGGSVTADVLPSDFAVAYGGGNPLSGRVFVQVGGMGMWGF
jgi:alcohol dehydrogenase